MARNPLAYEPDDPREPLNPLAAPAWPGQDSVSQGDAWKNTLSTIDDWLSGQQALAKERGLWNDETGFPTKAGMLDAVHQYAQSMVAGTQAPGMRGFVAYHGSPHDFAPTPRNPLGEFDPTKIGTGEGAQAYGYGIPYLAGKESVARGYRDALSKPVGGVQIGGAWHNILVDGQPTQRLSFNAQQFAQMEAEGFRTVEDSIKVNQKSLDRANEFISHYPDSQVGNINRDAAIRALQALDELKGKSITTIPATPGHMYEVGVNADPAHFLDWDKPMGQQPQGIASLAEQNARRVLDATSFGSTRNGAKDAILAMQSGNMTGEGLYRTLAMGQSKLGNLPKPAAASQALRDIGIPGIRYLDAGSRHAGDGTSNYVMFDPSLAQILRKYGLIGTLGAGAAATQDKDQ